MPEWAVEPRSDDAWWDDLGATDERDAVVASAVTGSQDDYSYLDGDEDDDG